METLNFGISSRKKEYAIEGTDKTIMLDLSDWNILDRFEQMQKNINAKIEEFTSGKSIDDAEDAIETYDFFKEIDKFMKAEINKTFDADISSVAFGVAHCLSTDDRGITYYEMFQDGACELLEKVFNTKVKKIKARAVNMGIVNKYTQNKGKHSK